VRTIRSARSMRRATPAASRRWRCRSIACDAITQRNASVHNCVCVCSCRGACPHRHRASAGGRAHKLVSAVNAESDAGSVPEMALYCKSLQRRQTAECECAQVRVCELVQRATPASASRERNKRTHRHEHEQTHAHTHEHTNTSTHTFSHRHTKRHTHARTNTHNKHTHTHKHKHKHTHTHTHTPTPEMSRRWRCLLSPCDAPTAVAREHARQYMHEVQTTHIVRDPQTHRHKTKMHGASSRPGVQLRQRLQCGERRGQPGDDVVAEVPVSPSHT
jgi:hypothetical protein